MSRDIQYNNDATSTGPFLLGLSLAISLFLGGAVRTFLGPQQVRSFIKKELAQRKTKFDLEFKEAKLSLSRGWWPRLGLELSQVSIQAKDICDTSLSMDIESVYVPIYLWKLFNQDLKLKTVELSKVKVFRRNMQRQMVCPVTGVDEDWQILESHLQDGLRDSSQLLGTDEHTMGTGDFDNFMEKFNRFIITRWAKELKNTSQVIDGIEIESLSVQGVLPQGIDANFRNIFAQVDPYGDSATLTFQVKPSSKMIFHQPLESFEFSVFVDKAKMLLQMQTGFKEGLWNLVGELELKKNELKLASSLSTFPLSEIVAGLSKSKVLQDIGDYPRSVWLSCEQNLNGSLVRWRELNFRVHDCAISGDLGNISLQDTESQPLSGSLLDKPLKVNVDHFSLRRFLEGLGVRATKGVMQKYGQLSGDIEIPNLKEATFRGKVEDFAVIVVRKSRRVIQSFQSLSGEMMYKDGRISAQIDEAVIDGGGFQGQVSLNLDNDFQEGYFQANVSLLDLHPSVDNLVMEGGSVGTVELYGRGAITGGKLTYWTGVLGVSDLLTNEMNIKEVKTKSQWEAGVFSGTLQIDQVSFGDDQPLYQLFQPLYLQELGEGDLVNWSEVESAFSLDGKKLSWKETKAIDKAKDIVFSSEGTWTSDLGLAGAISVDFPKVKMLSWTLTGTRERPLLTPMKRVLKELGSDRPIYKEPIAIEFEKSSDLFGKLIEFGENLDFKTITDKVVDSARSLIPQDEKADGDAKETNL